MRVEPPTSTTSLTSPLLTPASSSTFSTGTSVCRRTAHHMTNFSVPNDAARTNHSGQRTPTTAASAHQPQRPAHTNHSGQRTCRKRSAQSSSNLARVTSSEKSTPGRRPSISTRTCTHATRGVARGAVAVAQWCGGAVVRWRGCGSAVARWLRQVWRYTPSGATRRRDVQWRHRRSDRNARAAAARAYRPYRAWLWSVRP
jgi:hypothetical protein